MKGSQNQTGQRVDNLAVLPGEFDWPKVKEFEVAIRDQHGTGHQIPAILNSTGDDSCKFKYFQVMAVTFGYPPA